MTRNKTKIFPNISIFNFNHFPIFIVLEQTKGTIELLVRFCSKYTILTQLIIIEKNQQFVSILTTKLTLIVKWTPTMNWNHITNNHYI